MDKTELFIKQCDCPEVQDEWKQDEGDFYLPYGKDYIRNGYGPVDTVSGVRAVKEEKRREYLAGRIHERLIWLPRQDQIQEMLEPIELYELLDICGDGKGVMWEALHEYADSMEQLWLAFYMSKRHSKVWDSEKEKWVKK